MSFREEIDRMFEGELSNDSGIDPVEKMKELLGGRPRAKLGHNTFGRAEDGTFYITLHNTDIIKVDPDGTITVNSGGWHTATTKDRLNFYLGQLCGLGLAQRQGQWYWWPSMQPYSDGDQVVVGENGEQSELGREAAAQAIDHARKNPEGRAEAMRQAAEYAALKKRQATGPAAASQAAASQASGDS